MHFRNRDGRLVTVPGVAEGAGEAGGRPTGDPVRRHVRVRLAPVTAEHGLWVALEPVVDEAVARQVVVQPDHVGAAHDVVRRRTRAGC